MKTQENDLINVVIEATRTGSGTGTRLEPGVTQALLIIGKKNRKK